MATTIYGCVNRTTGEIDFEVCSPADFSGCIVRTGIHANQVKLIISGLGCDDTYYGCVNRETGKFQIVVPDDCCNPYSCQDCDPVPYYVRVVLDNVYFNGICKWGKRLTGDASGEYYIPPSGTCGWRLQTQSDCSNPIKTGFGGICYDNQDCTGDNCELTRYGCLYKIAVSMGNDPFPIRVEATCSLGCPVIGGEFNCSLVKDIFEGTKNRDSSCVNVASIPNELNDAEGTASVYDV